MPYRTESETARDDTPEQIARTRAINPNARWQVIVRLRDGSGDWCRESHSRLLSYAQVVEASDRDVAAAARRHGVDLTYHVEFW
ncbi:MAG: hypothetical protein AB7I59_01660 [Geminicoccaceae bacterium]